MDSAFRLAVDKAVGNRITGGGQKKENQEKMLSRVWFAGACLCEMFANLLPSVLSVSQMITGGIDSMLNSSYVITI